MRANNIVILFLAIMMGGAAAFLARNWLASHVSTAPAEPAGTVVVAVTPLAFGAEITGDNVAEIRWASTTVPEGAFATVRSLLKDGRRVVLTPLQRNEPVLLSKITAPGGRGSLSSLLENGKRAVTVSVDDVRGVAGFVLPGDRVDVVLIRNDAGGHSYSDVILQHVKVLAVDQQVDERRERPIVAKAVTLEVSTEDAQKVLLATNIGKLSLVLRQAGQGNPEASRRVTETDLSQVEPVAPPAEAIGAPVQRPASATVTIVRGLKHEEYAVMHGR